MASTEVFIVSDSTSLHVWLQQAGALQFWRRLPSVAFQLPEFSDDQNRRASVLANVYQRACGCKSGGFFMSIAAVTLVSWYFFTDGTLAGIGLAEAGTFLGVVMLAMTIGKLMGLGWARWRLRVLARDIGDAASAAAAGHRSR
jgi:hypothetical protein